MVLAFAESVAASQEGSVRLSIEEPVRLMLAVRFGFVLDPEFDCRHRYLVMRSWTLEDARSVETEEAWQDFVHSTQAQVMEPEVALDSDTVGAAQEDVALAEPVVAPRVLAALHLVAFAAIEEDGVIEKTGLLLLWVEVMPMVLEAPQLLEW